MGSRRYELAGRIRELREERGFTQPACAEAMGVSLRQWQRYEVEGTTKRPTSDRIAQVLSADPNYLWGGTRAEPPPDLPEQLRQLESKVDAILRQLRRR